MPESTPNRVRRSRWAAIGAAVAVALGGGGVGTGQAVIESGERPVFVAITPCRLMDTRPAPETVGPRSTPLGPNDTHLVTVHGTNGNCTIPSDAVAVGMNVAVVFPTASSFLTVHPAGVPRPLTANLNWTAEQPPVSNAVTVDIGAGGQIAFYNLTGQAHLTADVLGYYVDHTHDDRYAQLAHTHDDRYAQRQQTISYSALTMVPLGDSTLSSPGFTNCIAIVGTGGIGYVALDLPIGAQLQRVRLRVWDSNFNQTYSIGLSRFAAAASGNASTPLASTTGSGGINIVRAHTLTPAQSEIVDAGETFQVSFAPGGDTNALCGVEVDLLLP